jgi:pyridinium-3,5-bisthiocarboxylic acid mononucleotide nickel chelatase
VRGSPRATGSRGRRAPGTERALHFDCYSGAAGNMLLGALIAAGARPRAIRDTLAALGIPGLRMRVEQVERHPIAAQYVSFRGPERDTAQRRYREIRKLLRAAELPERVRERSQRAFALLAEAEARVHGIPADHVHFHEVGAVDAIGDVVGVAAALEDLGVARVTCSAIGVGSGTVDTEHGQLPLPAPATVELLCGVPTYPLDVRWETITPTGAAILRAVVDRFGAMEALVPAAQGFGAGNDRPGPLPNVVRAILGEPCAQLERDVVTVLETNLDDMSPEALPFLLERLLEAGALDASLAPIAMKKGRPGQLLRVIARVPDGERLAHAILTHSTAIGVRYQEVPRLKLAREVRRVATPYGRIAVKLVRAPDGRVTVSAEYEDCARAARKHEVPLAEVVRVAERAAEGLRP